MKQTQQHPTRSKSARHNERADNDTNQRKARKPSRETFILFDYGVPFRVSMPAGTFDRIAAKIAKQQRKQP